MKKERVPEKLVTASFAAKIGETTTLGVHFCSSYFWLILNAFHDKTISTIIETNINTKLAQKTRKSSQNTTRGSPRDPRALLKAAKGTP